METVTYVSIKHDTPPAIKCCFHEEYASFMRGFGYRVLAYDHTLVQSKVGAEVRAGPERKRLNTFYVQSGTMAIS